MSTALRVAPSVVLLDIEGTTVPVSFVHKILFPYARRTLPTFLATHGEETAVRAALDETRRLAPDMEPLERLLKWMDEDAKVAPLKTLQGLIWADGYARGELLASLYADVPPVLKAWKASGLTLAVYSSGSAPAQKLIYGHTTDGNLTGLFDAFLDLAMGGKKEDASYRRILAQEGWPAANVLFVSDIVAELDAARAAGMRTCQMARAEDGTVPGNSHPVAHTMNDVAHLFGLPEAAVSRGSTAHS